MQPGADIASYMDVDLSTEPAAFPRLIRANTGRTVMDGILGLARMRLGSYAPHCSQVRSREGQPGKGKMA